MPSKEQYVKNSAALLSALLEKLMGSKLTAIDLNSDGSTVRFDIDVSGTDSEISPAIKIVRIVLTGKPQFYFLSYLEIAAHRLKITDPPLILENNLILQGVAAPERQNLILYCCSHNQVAAGELHLFFSEFKLYDEFYGKLDPMELIKP